MRNNFCRLFAHIQADAQIVARTEIDAQGVKDVHSVRAAAGNEVGRTTRKRMAE